MQLHEQANRLYRIALAYLGNPQEAEDAVQDTFLKYYEKAPKNLENPAAWLTRVLINRCRDRLRSPQWREVPLWEALPAPEPEEQEELERTLSTAGLTPVLLRGLLHGGNRGDSERPSRHGALPAQPGPGTAESFAERRI